MVTTMWRLGSCLVIFLLTFGDFTDGSNENIHTINRTASQGETVVFHCNVSEDKGVDVGWRKEGILLFANSTYHNQTVTNYTSSRMYVDPNNQLKLQISNVQPSDAGNYSCYLLKTKVHWILTIKVSDVEPEPFKEMLLYIIAPGTGAVIVCFIIFCSVWIHRKRKIRNKETGDELQIQGRRRGRIKNQQYFERFNSLYGEVN